MTSVDPFLCAAVTGHFVSATPSKLGVAVSGGGDSMALMMILSDWASEVGVTLHAVTVDHRLREDSAQEAEMVGKVAMKLGLSHETLVWKGWKGTGNLQDAARRARYDLIGRWAGKHGIEQVALGHTADDQAETFLMRLGREAGIDGLSAMSVRRKIGAVEFVRPMLGQTRAALRDYLKAKNQRWIDDPSNDDARFDRIKARRALATLAPLGISATGIAQVAEHLGDARQALGWYAFLAARDLISIDHDDVVIERRGFRLLPAEIARRLVLRSLRWISGAPYGPRRKPVGLMLEAIRGGTSMTLAGGHLLVGRDHMRLVRETKAVAGHSVPAGQIWDGRWQLDGPWPEGAEIRALGEDGLAECPDWRETGLPREALTASPAVWRESALIAAPLAGRRDGWRAKPVRDAEEFYADLLSH